MVAYAFPMRVRVLYFAILKDVFGCEREELELPVGATVSELLEVLGGRGGSSGECLGVDCGGGESGVCVGRADVDGWG